MFVCIVVVLWRFGRTNNGPLFTAIVAVVLLPSACFTLRFYAILFSLILLLLFNILIVVVAEIDAFSHKLIYGCMKACNVAINSFT